jgi:hypothetical protein
MVSKRILTAQRGIPLADLFARRPAAGRPTAPSKAAPRMGGALATAGRAAAPKKARKAGRRSKAAAGGSLSGPFLSPGALTRRERLTLVDGIEKVLGEVFTHLPLKKARYGFDPVQRLRILRSLVADLSDDGFHHELADIVTRLRDAHTRYAGPATLAGHVAVLPFLVEMAGSATQPVYVVSNVAPGLDPAFKPGVVIETWNGVPIDLAIQRYSEREVGGRPDTLRAWATQSLTTRALRYGPPPDEAWVVIGYRTASGTAKETRIEWAVVNPDEVSPPSGSLFGGRRDGGIDRVQAVNPAAEAVRRARMLLFAPRAIEGTQAQAPAPAATGKAGKTAKGKPGAATIIPTALTETLKAVSIEADAGPFGYLRIYAFDSHPDSFIPELIRLVGLLPDRGLILDLRGNPGGYIWAAELALQLFTPNRIEPTRFSVLATDFTRRMASTTGPLKTELAQWKPSLEAAIRNGELYAQPIPITDREACNWFGQQYGGPVVLVADATTYSAGDLFSAGFVDNAIGPFICVGSATGAGGANVWTYDDLRADLAGTDLSLPTLPDGIGLSFSFRRATRAGPNEGLPIEDVGISGMPYAMTMDDLEFDRRDLIAQCIATLRKQPFSRLQASVHPPSRTIEVITEGLDRLDVLVDGHPGEPSRPISDAQPATVTYPEGATIVELTAYAGKVVRQRRRLAVNE